MIFSVIMNYKNQNQCMFEHKNLISVKRKFVKKQKPKKTFFLFRALRFSLSCKGFEIARRRSRTLNRKFTCYEWRYFFLSISNWFINVRFKTPIKLLFNDIYIIFLAGIASRLVWIKLQYIYIFVCLHFCLCTGVWQRLRTADLPRAAAGQPDILSRHATNNTYLSSNCPLTGL